MGAKEAGMRGLEIGQWNPSRQGGAGRKERRRENYGRVRSARWGRGTRGVREARRQLSIPGMRRAWHRGPLLRSEIVARRSSAGDCVTISLASGLRGRKRGAEEWVCDARLARGQG